MEALAAAAIPAPPREQGAPGQALGNGMEGPSQAAQNGELVGGLPAESLDLQMLSGKAEVQMAEAALLLGAQGSQHTGSDGPQPILELPNGLPGQQQAGPKYKRGRGRSFFKEQPKKGAVCQVPGCERSLHKLRDYYKRYKICPYHLELPCLVVEGQTIRFCQQCGRFQLLSDFEGDRRSCRRKLDKHNERRRKAEAEQKARMLDSGSDSPGGSTRANKAHRISPYRGGKGYDSHTALMMGLGGGSGDLGSRLKALANDPTLREGIAPGLLQSLADPGLGGMDWLAAGSLTNLALGSSGMGAAPPPLPPMPQPQPSSVLPPELMALLPADVQQQVAQQGPGILNSALLMQLQQVEQQAAPPPAVQLPTVPQPQRGFSFGGLFGTSAPPPPPPAQAPYGAALPPATSAAALLGPSLQQQLQLHQQPPAQAQRTHLSPSDLPPVSLDGASVFMQQPQQVQQVQQASPPGVPLLRSEPAGVGLQPQPQPPPKAEQAGPADTKDKAALLVALARSVGVSSQELAKALMENGMDTEPGPAGAAADAAAAAAGLSAPQDAAGGALPAGQQQQQQQPPLSLPLSLQQQGSDSLGRMPSGGMGQQPLPGLLDGSRPGSCSAVAAASGSPTRHEPPLQQQPQPQPGGAFNLPAAPLPAPPAPAAPAAPLPPAGSGALPAALQPPANGVAASAAAAPAAAQPSHPPLDLDQLQSAVQNNGLSPGFATDANLLLQLVAAVEAAQRDTGPGKDRMHSLSLKLFNCTPERLPKNILEQLENWMVQNKSLLDGASRPGCVQLSVSALMTGEEFAALSNNFSSMVQHLARNGLGGVQTSILAQLDGRASLLDASKQQLMQLDTAGSAGAVPVLSSVRPMVVTPGYSGPILVTGHSIGDPQDTIYCRNGDKYPTTEVLGRGVLMRNPEGHAGDKHWVLLRIPSLQEGCHRLEAQRGMFVSAPHSLLVLDDEEAVGELRQLEAAESNPFVTELLHRLGMVLQFGRAMLSEGAGSSYDSALLCRIAQTAQELAATCLLRGWAAVLRLVLLIASVGCSMDEAVAGIEQQLGGMPILHAAVLTGAPRVVQALGAWAQGAVYRLHLEARWGGGLTALHVAALLREPESVAVALTGLFHDTAPALWASASAHHGNETPLGLACRLNKRELLRQLSLHGVPAAGAMLAALQLQDASAGSADAPPLAAPRLPAGVEGDVEELTHQRRQWAKVYAKAVHTQDALSMRMPDRPSHSWPGVTKSSYVGKSQPREIGAKHGSTGKLPPLPRSGQESPSSVLAPLQGCTADAALHHCRSPSGSSKLGCSEEEGEQAGSAAAAAAVAAAAAMGVGGSSTGKCTGGQDRGEQSGAAAAAASFYLPFKAEPSLCGSEGLPPTTHGSKADHEGKEGAGGAVWGFPDAATERRFRKWHSSKLAKMDTAVFCFLAVLSVIFLAAAPTHMRQQLHMWLLNTVARAPLMLQPLLLLCHPVRQAYRRSRDAVLVTLHLTVFALQYFAAQARGAAWLTSNTVLMSYPAGLWLLVAVFTLQLRFALQAPALLVMYVANVALLPAACQQSVGTGAARAVPSCVAVSGARMFVVVVLLPLLSAWLLEARARTVFAAMHTVGEATG